MDRRSPPAGGRAGHACPRLPGPTAHPTRTPPAPHPDPRGVRDRSAPNAAAAPEPPTPPPPHAAPPCASGARRARARA